MVFIRIPNPDQDVYTLVNQLASVARREKDGELNVLENNDIQSGYYILGELGNQRTELIKPLSIANHLVVLAYPLEEDHTQATNIYHTYYNKISVFRKIGDIKQLWKTIDIDWANSVTILEDPDYEGYIAQNNTVEYSTKYTNGSNGDSTIEKVAFIGDASGFNYIYNKTNGQEIIRECSLKAFGDAVSKKRNPSEWLLDINETIAEINNEVIWLAHDEYLITQSDIQIVADKANYLLPADFDSVLDIRLDGCTIPARSLTRKRQTCNDGNCKDPCVTETTVDPCAIVCDTPEKTSTCEQSCTPFVEYFYQITQGEIIIDPVPSREMLLSITYYGLPTVFTQSSESSIMPPGFRELIVAGALFRYYLYYDLSTESAVQAKKMSEWYVHLKQLLQEKILMRSQGRKPTQNRMVKGIRAETLFEPNQGYRFPTPKGYNSYMY